jgi:hypothetical protein
MVSLPSVTFINFTSNGTFICDTSQSQLQYVCYTLTKGSLRTKHIDMTSVRPATTKMPSPMRYQSMIDTYQRYGSIDNSHVAPPTYFVHAPAVHQQYASGNDASTSSPLQYESAPCTRQQHKLPDKPIPPWQFTKTHVTCHYWANGGCNKSEVNC